MLAPVVVLAVGVVIGAQQYDTAGLHCVRRLVGLGNPPLQMSRWLACTAWLDIVPEVRATKFQQSRSRISTAVRLFGLTIWPTSEIRTLMTCANVTVSE